MALQEKKKERKEPSLGNMMEKDEQVEKGIW